MLHQILHMDSVALFLGALLSDAAPVLVVIACVAMGCWIFFSRGLRGTRLARWMAAPVLMLAGLACLLGPGRFLPKDLEGQTIFVVNYEHGLTVLDLLGFVFIAVAIGLGYRFLRRRTGWHGEIREPKDWRLP